MNRIILAGNGFDLAHGLPTRYEDFINWYWEQWGERLKSSPKKYENDAFCSFKLKDEIGFDSWCYFWTNRYESVSDKKSLRDIVKRIRQDEEVCEFQQNSVFFKQICQSIETKGWVDIENEYYNIVKQCAFEENTNGIAIEELNEHLYQLQVLLVKYLDEVSHDVNINKEIKNIIFSPIQKNDISVRAQPLFNEACLQWVTATEQDRQRLFKLYHDDEMPVEKYKFEDFPQQFIFPENILLLSFNYTSITDLYSHLNLCQINHIHGDLSIPESIIFGYGDELDEDYKALLKLNNNEYLRNIKSVKYLESNNYRAMLSFIESAPYQIYIMGHSCGNSDRTLLNTLFEHENCISIKPFYYQKEEGSDNYLDIVQNICRNFTDMKLMRDKVVNKTLCEPFPQSKSKSLYNNLKC